MKIIKSKFTKSNNCWSTIGVWSDTHNKCDRLREVVHCRNCEIFSMAGREVFESRPPAGYLDKWKEKISNKKSEREKGDIGAMIFRLGHEWLCLPVEYLQEVIENRNVHKIPHNDNAYILGIVNAGGEIVLCYSLMNLLNIEEDIDNDKKELRRLVVIIINGEKFVIPVCEVRGIARYSSVDIVKAPAKKEKLMGKYLSGVFKINKQKIASLNIEEIYRGFEGAKT